MVFADKGQISERIRKNDKKKLRVIKVQGGTPTSERGYVQVFDHRMLFFLTFGEESESGIKSRVCSIFLQIVMRPSETMNFTEISLFEMKFKRVSEIIVMRPSEILNVTEISLFQIKFKRFSEIIVMRPSETLYFTEISLFQIKFKRPSE